MTSAQAITSLTPYIPWTDARGRLSPFKLFVFLGILLPGLLLAYGLLAGTLGSKPVEAAIHETGDWAIRYLFLSLSITPLRRIASWPKLIQVRRMLGLAALGYALLHLTFYAADEAWDLQKVASEIVLRIYLTIGFTALFMMALLGATSTDGAIRKMGANWNRLHKVAYAIAILAGLHFFMQSKSDVTEATLMSGFFVLLMGYRIAHRLKFDIASPLTLAVVAALSGLATAGLEYAWYAIATGIPAERVLAANLDFSYSIRPAWWVAFTGFAVTALPILVFLRDRLFKSSGPRVSSART
ncbi:sulfoxide reductase heme-binding subunit YedZ [Rhizobiales bacterium]|uniref:sulfite oxidase heme-binding subunit YedZ n=1 Tax=Hongsoonwoonella zoysiae TaxID=2821844 RepID=UPI001560F53A|nr:protein-methionine-sulfoxide reductase heme-binding subunit MsrQ [Hongsoonwoonella zoysiae]NRG17140.1 sulfoxide reductase heme-binding subunit YedZ [Hongsoonwoonella zoysiae]